MPSDIHVTGANKLIFNGKEYRCATGANGFTDTPREGDKATPKGVYSLRECWFRPDKMKQPVTRLAIRAISEKDGWCDDPNHSDYNRHVELPFSASHELLWRPDRTYDVIVPIGFNDSPIVPGLGSAIFFHIARPDYSPTLGCVAVSMPDMLEILPQLSADSTIQIGP